MGVRTRRVEKYYQDLLAPDTNSGDIAEHQRSELDSNALVSITEESACVPEKWKGQIEKVITYSKIKLLFNNFSF